MALTLSCCTALGGGTVLLLQTCLQSLQRAMPGAPAGGPRAVLVDPAAAQAALGGLAAGAAALICGWLLLGVLVGVADAITAGAGVPTLGRTVHLAGPVGALRRAAPRRVSCAVTAMLAISAGVTTGVPVGVAAPAAASAADLRPDWAGMAQAMPGAGGSGRHLAEEPAVRLDPGWTPSRPSGRHRVEPVATGAAAPAAEVAATATVPPRRPGASVDPRDEVVVRTGDTLWAIAARHLGRDASDAQIALEWPTWFAANRDRIGPDPDLLVPGRRLVAPAPQPTPTTQEAPR